MSLDTQRLAQHLEDYAESLGQSGVVVDQNWNEVHRQWRALVDCLDAEWIDQLQPVMERAQDFFNEYSGSTQRLDVHLRQSAEKLRRFDR